MSIWYIISFEANVYVLQFRHNIGVDRQVILE